jgi:hypothetical protein
MMVECDSQQLKLFVSVHARACACVCVYNVRIGNTSSKKILMSFQWINPQFMFYLLFVRTDKPVFKQCLFLNFLTTYKHGIKSMGLTCSIHEGSKKLI